MTNYEKIKNFTLEEMSNEIKAMRLWCYGLSEKGKYYGNEVYPLEERWEAVEKGEELARYEGLTQCYIGRVGDDGESVEDIEKIEVKPL